MMNYYKKQNPDLIPALFKTLSKRSVLSKESVSDASKTLLTVLKNTFFMSYWLCGAMWRLDYKTLSSTSEKLRDVISKSEQIVLANSLGLICTPNSVKLIKETQWPQELIETKAIEKIESKMHNWNIFTFPPLFPSLVEAMWCYFFASGDKRAVLVNPSSLLNFMFNSNKGNSRSDSSRSRSRSWKTTRTDRRVSKD